jgi:hypothetical protein
MEEGRPGEQNEGKNKEIKAGRKKGRKIEGGAGRGQGGKEGE